VEAAGEGHSEDRDTGVGAEEEVAAGHLLVLGSAAWRAATRR
jgi:hypothetical protein